MTEQLDDSGNFRPVWSHPGTAQAPRRRPMVMPRELQDSPKRPQEASRSAQTPLGAISKRFWTNFGGPGTSKNHKKCCTVVDFRGLRDFAREPSTEAQEAQKGAPREAQMSPRRAPGGPRSDPRAPKTAPRGARSAPRGAQDHPGAPQESTQGAQAAQTPPGSPSGAHFGLILEPPGPHFRAF